jgi:large subunit ribosomal protein L23
VSLRRAAQGISEDLLPSGLTPAEKNTYDRLKARGDLIAKDGSRELTEEEWLKLQNERRSRVRGERVNLDAPDSKTIIGQRIYFPNIIFRLVRNNTPPGQPYNPYEATFRVPQSLTKLDIRQYLLAVYGVETTYIRTTNYVAPLRRMEMGKPMQREAHGTYKKAVVGLVEPFYHPDLEEDMTIEQRAERRKYLENEFQLERTQYQRKKYLETVMGIKAPGSLDRTKVKILKKRMTRQDQRQEAIQNAVREMITSGEPSIIPTSSSSTSGSSQ